MDNQPITVVGAGFVPGVAGVYGNNTIPAEQKEDAPVLPAQDAPNAPSPLPSEQEIHLAVAPVQEAQPSPSQPSESNGGD